MEFEDEDALVAPQSYAQLHKKTAQPEGMQRSDRSTATFQLTDTSEKRLQQQLAAGPSPGYGKSGNTKDMHALADLCFDIEGNDTVNNNVTKQAQQ